MEYLGVFCRVGFFFAMPLAAKGHRRILRSVCFGPLRMEKIMMRRSMTGFRNVQFNGVATLHRLTFRRVSSLLAVASVLAVAPAFAKDPAATEVKPTNKGPAIRAQAQPVQTGTENRPNNRGPATQSQAHSETSAIPECLEKLNLTPQQQDQIKEIVHNYDGSIGVVWKQFSDRYMQAICLESSLLAAIEDNLTDAQRQQVRDQRHKTAQHEKLIAATSTKVNQAKVAPNEETTKPASAAKEELAAVGVSLTDEQESAADKVQEKYRPQLRSMNRDIQGLHTQLVSLEADKLVEIEKVLTKDQLAQLRTHRQNAPAAPKVAISRTEPTKSE